MSNVPLANAPKKTTAIFAMLIAMALITITVIAGTAAAATVWATQNHNQQMEQQAIIRVYNQRKLALDALKVRSQHHMSWSQNFNRATTDLLHVDLTGCPTDFQQKYIENLKAFGEMTMDVKTETGLLGFARTFSEAYTLDGKSITDDLKGLNRAVLAFQLSNEDLAQCVRNHGLTVK